jgi:hypothetical protein
MVKELSYTKSRGRGKMRGHEGDKRQMIIYTRVSFNESECLLIWYSQGMEPIDNMGRKL